MALNKFNANKKIAERISDAIKAGNVLHAYIIEGDLCVDKVKFAMEFCKALMCTEKTGEGCDFCINCRKIDHGNYEDLYFIEADGMSVKDEQISKLQEDLKKKPVGRRNLAIINNADTMTPRAQNRLLKTLEEPFPGTVIILLSENRENLLETIKSRCVLYRLEDIEHKEFNQESAEAVFDALADGKNFYELKGILSVHLKSREDAFVLLDGLERIYEGFLLGKDPRRKLYRNEEVIRCIEYIEQARRDLIAKVNYQYAVKNLIIKIGG